MALSLFELFKIGIGPSSSHTVGPMVAAERFARSLEELGLLAGTARITAELYGSLGATGRGHGSAGAVLTGLQGHTPAAVDPLHVGGLVEQLSGHGWLRVLDRREIRVDPGRDLVFHKRRSLPHHPNGLVFTAYDADDATLHTHTYYSVGGGFVTVAGDSGPVEDDTPLPYAFTTADQLLAHCREHELSIADIMLANESVWRPAADIRAQLGQLWSVMQECVENGLRNEQELPGGLHVRRRAPALHRKLVARADRQDRLDPMDWLGLHAIAVNEENAAGGRVVTAPTNGAAGIIPAALHYYRDFVAAADEDGVATFLLTAAAIGIVIKLNASISGAEVGCQGEVGSACAMAAAGLAAVFGGTPAQIENAAEIGIEHNLGLTCDPIGGLVQIPCIERNAVGAVKALGAARMALNGDGEHMVSLDKAVRTMRETGRDMLDKYKETSRGGLAVNVIDC